MREIKFRAWNGKSFFYPSKLLFQDDGSLTHLWTWNNGDFSWQPIGDYEIVQYTGLTDKNGKEIYEGDVVKDIWSKYQVVWHMTGFEPFASGTLNWATCEIIGNIYENPDLTE